MNNLVFKLYFNKYRTLYIWFLFFSKARNNTSLSRDQWNKQMERISSTMIHKYLVINYKNYWFNARNTPWRRYTCNLFLPLLLHHIYLFLPFLTPFSPLFHSSFLRFLPSFSQSSPSYHPQYYTPIRLRLASHHVKQADIPQLTATFSWAVKGGLDTYRERYGSLGKCYLCQCCANGMMWETRSRCRYLLLFVYVF